MLINCKCKHLYLLFRQGSSYVGKTKDLSNLRLWGYRNVWCRFDISEADIIVPVILNSMAIMRSTFNNCYLSQKKASFPSYVFDGPFCDL